MEKKQYYSDLSQDLIPDDERVIATVIQHPDLEGPVRLDGTGEELSQERIGKLALDPVIVQIQRPGEDEVERYTMTPANFGKLAVKGAMKDVLASATPVLPDKPAARANGNNAPAVDYTQPELSGRLHRGKVTDKEAAWVRTNLDAANANRAAAGQPKIDPNNPDDRRRYGFGQPEPATQGELGETIP